MINILEDEKKIITLFGVLLKVNDIKGNMPELRCRGGKKLNSDCENDKLKLKECFKKTHPAFSLRNGPIHTCMCIWLP